MDNIVEFFNTESLKITMREAERILQVVDKPTDAVKYKVEMLGSILVYINGKSEDFDKKCQFNIQSIGSNLSARLHHANYDEKRIDVDYLLVTFHRFVTEYDLSSDNVLPIELEAYQHFIRSIVDDFGDVDHRSVKFTDQQLCVKMMKALLHDSKVGDLRNVPEAAKKINDVVVGWEQSLQEKNDSVVKLEKSLIKYKADFNFLAFDVGFGHLANNKYRELKWSRVGMAIFGMLLPIPLIFELVFVFMHRSDILKVDALFFIATGAISFSLTLLLIYFFKIILRNSESCKSQILQLELRRELCRFIQAYVEYAEDLKTKSPETLAKFESLIFSAITMSSEQSPSMFEGIDKIGDLIKSYKS